MVITTKALELQKDAVITWNWKERDAPAGRELAGNREFLSQRREGRKKLDSVRICFLLTGIGIALFGIQNHILKFKIDDEDREYTTVDQEAINHVQEKLKDNKRALEVLDYLVEESVRYQKLRKRNRYVTILMCIIAAIMFAGEIYVLKTMETGTFEKTAMES